MVPDQLWILSTSRLGRGGGGGEGRVDNGVVLSGELGLHRLRERVSKGKRG